MGSRPGPGLLPRLMERKKGNDGILYGFEKVDFLKK
jgi:hypothetical protein